jgi:hypothetical protein
MMHIRGFFLLLLCVSVAAGSACGTRLYNVAPIPSAGMPPEISADGVNGLSAGALLIDGDASLDRFDANLPLAGVIAVDVRVANKGASPIDASRIGFALRSASGKTYVSLTPRKALDQVMKYYGASLYPIAARQQTRTEYAALDFSPIGQIAPQEERRGVLFFRTEKNTTDLSGLRLEIKAENAALQFPLSTQ